MLFDELRDTVLLTAMAVLLGIMLIHYRPWKKEHERNRKKNRKAKGQERSIGR